MAASIEQFASPISTAEFGRQLETRNTRGGLYALVACTAIGVASWAGFAMHETPSSDAPEKPPITTEQQAAVPTTQPANPCKNVVTLEMVQEDAAAAMAKKERCLQQQTQGMGLVASEQ